MSDSELRGEIKELRGDIKSILNRLDMKEGIKNQKAISAAQRLYFPRS